MAENTERALGVLDILEPSDVPGPKPGLGGWGLPSSNAAVEAGSLGLILGYCLEKVTNQFAFLRGLTVKGAELAKSMANASLAAPGAKVNIDASPYRKDAEAALSEANDGLAQGDSAALQALIMNEDLLHALNKSERKSLLHSIVNHANSDDTLFQQATLFLLRNAGSSKEFKELLEAAGGVEAYQSRLRGLYLGAFHCLLEHFEVSNWSPPFYHGIFTGEVAGDPTEGDDPLAALKKQVVPGADPLIHEDYLDRFVQGDATIAEMMGLSREELYMIANRGYELMQEGKLGQARQVFDGLVYLDPYDPYFYTVLGSVCQKQESYDDAVKCYDVGIRLQAWNINALANRGEILLNQGRLEEALRDLQLVIYYEPDADNKNPSVVRTKALLYTIKELVDQKTQESSEA